ncbi:early transcribed membrane protein [Plasmodium ovale curtisi]|uniref:Early transcribed membrane protein n=1 Tax=Plasmodium ovale curtisi TaxID=864141 RepID=A0A1A8VM50_PLAOA|nr:early transcribed membrane protein [Plasmodium ovale curtisi]
MDDSTTNYMHMDDQTTDGVLVTDAATDYMPMADATMDDAPMTYAATDYVPTSDGTTVDVHMTDAATDYVPTAEVTTVDVPMTDAATDYVPTSDATTVDVHMTDAATDYVPTAEVTTVDAAMNDAAIENFSADGTATDNLDSVSMYELEKKDTIISSDETRILDQNNTSEDTAKFADADFSSVMDSNEKEVSVTTPEVVYFSEQNNETYMDQSTPVKREEGLYNTIEDNESANLVSKRANLANEPANLPSFVSNESNNDKPTTSGMSNMEVINSKKEQEGSRSSSKAYESSTGKKSSRSYNSKDVEKTFTTPVRNPLVENSDVKKKGLKDIPIKNVSKTPKISSFASDGNKGLGFRIHTGTSNSNNKKGRLNGQKIRYRRWIE